MIIKTIHLQDKKFSAALPVSIIVIAAFFLWPAAFAKGKETIEYANGDVYKGETLNGQRHGKGKLSCHDGKTYEGEWINDEIRHGKLTYKNTGYYEGYFRNMTLDGYGERHYPDKTVKGMWKENNRHGIVEEKEKGKDPVLVFYRNGIKMNKINITKGEYVMGIDLSAWQKNVVWQDLYLCGNTEPDYRLPRSLEGDIVPVEFVIMKATEGGDHVDSMLSSHRDNAERHNYRRGYYHFYNTTASATANAANYIRNVTLSKEDLPPILDIEKDNVPVDSLTKWLKIVEKHYGKKPMIYTNERYYKKYVEGTKLAKYPLWYSRYGRRDIVRNAHIFQFTEKGLIDGVRDHVVDINEFRRNDL